MAYQNKITSWLFQNRHLLNPQFTDFNWPTRYFKDIFDFEAEIEVDGVHYRGRGIHEIKTVALEKASSEAIEHLICDKLKIRSVGFALSGESDAETHARHEAFERYFFNEHIRQNLPFEFVQYPECELYKPVISLSEKFNTYNTNAQAFFYKMSTPKHVTGTVCNISLDKNHPQFLGLSLHVNPQQAACHAFYEALANYARKNDSPETFDIEVGKDQNLWTCNPEFLQGIKHLFAESASVQQIIPLPDVFTQKLDISIIKELLGCPIQPTRCVLAKKDFI